MDDNIEILFCQLLRHKADGTPVYYMELAGPAADGTPAAVKPTTYDGGEIGCMSLYFEDTGKVYNMTAAGSWAELYDFTA